LLREVSMKRHPVLAFLLLVNLTSAAWSQAVATRVRTSESFMEGLAITKVAPLYPPLARQAQIQGSVILKVQISKTGDVVDIQVVSGHPLLAPAAIDAREAMEVQALSPERCPGRGGKPSDGELHARR